GGLSSVQVSEIFTQPTSNTVEQAVRVRPLGSSRRTDLGLPPNGVGDESGRSGKGGAGSGFGQAGDPDRPAHADLLVEYELRKLARSGELRGAAGEDDPPAGELVEAARFQARAYQLEGFFQPGLDDADQDRLGDLVGLARAILADLRHVDEFALVGRGGERAAVESLHP